MFFSQELFLMLSKSNLTGEEQRVLFYLISKLDFESYVVIKQTEAAKEIGIRQASISRAMKKLKEMDIIQEGPRAGMIKSYRLNPDYGFNGDLSDLQDQESYANARKLWRESSK